MGLGALSDDGPHLHSAVSRARTRGWGLRPDAGRVVEGRRDPEAPVTPSGGYASETGALSAHIPGKTGRGDWQLRLDNASAKIDSVIGGKRRGSWALNTAKALESFIAHWIPCSTENAVAVAVRAFLQRRRSDGLVGVPTDEVHGEGLQREHP